MSQYTFSRAPQINVPRSVFRRNHSLKTTIGVDYLYPIYVDEALPGDTFEFRQNLFGRLSTPLTPLMDNLYLDTFFFAVPVRLVDKDFKKFMGERPFGDVRNDYTAPMLTAPDKYTFTADDDWDPNLPIPEYPNGASKGFDFCSLYDYLGLPPDVSGYEFSAWYPRAYNLIYNEWFRDENLCAARPVAGVYEDGTTSDEKVEDYELVKRCKRLDYFTGCLPWPQKGETAYVPLGDSASVYGDGRALMLTYDGSLDDDHLYALGTGNSTNSGYYQHNLSMGLRSFSTNNELKASIGTQMTSTSKTVGVATKGQIDNANAMESSFTSGLVADLTSATAITINQLREAFAVQQLMEAWARGGTRYIEILRACFNVVSPDARLQRPEYLGGVSVPLNVTTVAQTSAATSDSPLGNLASFVTMTSHAYWKKSFLEHTVIIGLANVRAELSYQQGLPRMFSRKTKYDFYWPQLANLGEQAVLNKEIYCDSSDADSVDNDGVFGYQERWAEYRYHPNYITGKMRSTCPTSLDVWHLSQEFSELPKLNNSFVNEKVPIERILAVTDEPPVILWGDFMVKCARPMPLYSVPGLRRM